uniref:Uncharacterized protein n=1 Tax=Anopheles merus TaxID=30066 RepID=A0A182US81_ANOME
MIKYDICRAPSLAMLLASSSSVRNRVGAVLLPPPPVATPAALVLAPTVALPPDAPEDVAAAAAVLAPITALEGAIPVPRKARRTPSDISECTSLAGFVSDSSFRRFEDSPEMYASENGA